MKVRKCPTDELAVTNAAVVNQNDFDYQGVKWVQYSLFFDNFVYLEGF